MTRVLLENVSKVFDKQVTAVSDFRLEVADSEFMVIVGPSGSGKTTILRMIAGLEKVTSGNIYIGDTLVNDVPPRNRDIAMVFQNYALYPHMNVYENIAFGLKMRKFSKEEINRRVKKASKLLGIEHLLARKPTVRRTFKQSRYRITWSHSGPIKSPAPQIADYLYLCHSRPDGSHDPGGPYLRDL
jgi:multiple sugar transport system ATP-binding protein